MDGAAVLHTARVVSLRAPAVTGASATAIARCYIVLASYEIGIRRPLPWTIDNVPVSPDGAYMALKDLNALRGPAAVAVHDSLLYQLAGHLAIATDEAKVAYSASAAAGGSTPAHGAVATTAAAPADAPAAPPICTAPVLPKDAAGQAPAAAHSGPTAIARIATVVTAFCEAHRLCLSSKELQPLLAPDTPSGTAWAQALAIAVPACSFGQEALGAHAPDMPRRVVVVLVQAGNRLYSAASELLRHYCAAGLDTLQQDPSVLLLEALTDYLSSYPTTKVTSGERRAGLCAVLWRLRSSSRHTHALPVLEDGQMWIRPLAKPAQRLLTSTCRAASQVR